MSTTASYKTEASVNNLLPIYLDPLINIRIGTDIKPSSNFVWTDLIPLGWRSKPDVSSEYRESFIGMLEPGEADRMKREVALFKKRFNDAFARKHQILFGE